MALPAGFVIPKFHNGEQDHEDFVDQFVAYINLANINDNARIVNILDRAVKGEVRQWYHREFDNKNWKLQNVLDNSGIGANIGAIRRANEGAIAGAAASFPNVSAGLTVPVAVNAEGGVLVILAGIRAGQRLFQIKKHYLTANRYVRMLEIGSLKQGAHERVREDIREEVYRIGQHRPINDILDNLAELELRRGVLGPPPPYLNYTPTPPINSNIAPQQQGISLLEEQLLKTERWLDIALNAGNILMKRCSQLMENRSDV
ncbi:9386_t:CDS:2 [Gigaspora margarita]|uniref:9386_t:CDS:1 n=1 Tax=Gigaspora margarita TaxID=4874 RepID=A0ABM8VWH4_GIGMA|nr:9386_t:CDS:2 [Gigaspora margarita]